MIYSKTLKQVWSIISSWQLDFIQSRLSDSCHCQLTRHDIIFSTGQVSSHWPSLWQVIYVWVSLFIFPLPMLPCSGMSAFIKLNILPCLIFWVQSRHTFCRLLLSHWIRLLDRCTCQPKKETACLPFIFSVCGYSKRFERQMSESNLDISDCESWSLCTQT